MARIDLVECSKCGYDLTGLTVVGRCPECGQRYHTRTGEGVFRSGDVRQRTERRMRHLRTILLGAATLMVMVLTGIAAGLANSLAKNPGPVLIIGGLVGLILIMGTLISYLGERE